MKRITSLFLVVILGLSPALLMLSACSSTGNNAAQAQAQPPSQGRGYTEEEAQEQRKVGLILFPFIVALSPLILVGFAAHSCSKENPGPTAPPKGPPRPPINPLPQTS